MHAKILDPNTSQGLTLVKIFDLDHVRGLTPAKALCPDPCQGVALVKIFNLYHVRGLTPAKILKPKSQLIDNNGQNFRLLPRHVFDAG